MNAHTSRPILAVIAVIGAVSLMPAFSQLSDDVGAGQGLIGTYGTIPITIETDSSTYDHDSVIIVSGAVANLKSGFDITLTVTSPSNSVIVIRQIEVDENLGFSTSFNTDGTLWKYDGVYTIRAQYGEHGTNNRVLVELTDGIEQPTRPVEASCGESELTVDNSCVPYSISGGTVTGASATSGDFTTMSITISSTDDGVLSIQPLRQGCSEDGDPLVYVDGEQADDYVFDGTSLDIAFSSGAQSIEISGTCVIPEFGTIAVMILAVAIVSIIAVTTRSRLAMPRF